MRVIEALRRVARNIDSTAELLRAVVAGIDNVARLVHDKLQALIAGMDNQSRLLDEKLQRLPSIEDVGRLEAVVSNLAQELGSIRDYSSLIAARSEQVISGIDNQARGSSETAREVIEGINNLAQLLNEKLGSLRDYSSLIATRSEQAVLGIDNQARRSNEAAREIIVGIDNLAQLLGGKLADSAGMKAFLEAPGENDELAIGAQLAATNSGEFSNLAALPRNVALSKLIYFRTGNRIEHDAWSGILQNAYDEVKSLPNTGSVLKALAIARNSRQGQQAESALLLFWLVRVSRPLDVVQIAESCEVSSLLIVLALAKNGGRGRLHLLGVSGAESELGARWALSEGYRSRCQMRSGDPKVLLAELLNRLERVEFFVEGSSSMRERTRSALRQVHQRLLPGAIMAAEGAIGVEAIRDFAGEQGAPFLDFNRSLGVAFF
jgi:hypothetical protein